MIAVIGIIAEDDSDVSVIDEILRKITPGKKYRLSKFVGNGCGRIRSKCREWAKNLKERGCTLLIIIHDFDRPTEIWKNSMELNRTINEKLSPSPITDYTIIIPIHEIEAWFLADHDAINKAFKFHNPIKTIRNPEAILRPKEYLRDLIFLKSKNKTRYVNSLHNQKIAKHLSIRSLDRCRSFTPLKGFIQLHLN